VLAPHQCWSTLPPMLRLALLPPLPLPPLPLLLGVCSETFFQ
jgi:hypothetical protein